MPLFQINAKEIPIKMYNNVQAGPKTQFGGLKDGLISVEYQPVIALVVEIPDKPPKIKQASMEIVSLMDKGSDFIIRL